MYLSVIKEMLTIHFCINFASWIMEYCFTLYIMLHSAGKFMIQYPTDASRVKYSCLPYVYIIASEMCYHISSAVAAG